MSLTARSWPEAAWRIMCTAPKWPSPRSATWVQVWVGACGCSEGVGLAREVCSAQTRGLMARPRQQAELRLRTQLNRGGERRAAAAGS